MDTLFQVMTLIAVVALAQSSAPKGEWPLPGHDTRHLAQAELPCKMSEAPKEVWSYNLGKLPYPSAMCADVDDDGEPEILYGGGPLICTTLSGQVKWTSGCGQVLAIADIDGDGRTELLTNYGPRIVSGRTGEILWARTGPPGVSGICCAKLLPDVKGLQVAVLSHEYATMTKHAQVWSFAEGCDKGKLVWGRDFDTWEHSGLTVGPFDQHTMCLISPTWGGFSAMDARDGSELMRMYWENAPGVSGLRNYGPLQITDLDGDGRPEYVVLADNIAQHIDVIALWRGSPGDHAERSKPLPAPDVPEGALASYRHGPLLWQRYFGTNYPTGDRLLKLPTYPVADVDGDGTKEIIVTVGKERWELKVYDGMTGAEKLSIPHLQAEAVVDLDGDGIPEIVARYDDALVIGDVENGKWHQRLRLRNCKLAYTQVPIPPQEANGLYKVESRPIGVQYEGKHAWVAVQDTTHDGRVDHLLLLTPGSHKAFHVTRQPIDNDLDIHVLASWGDLLAITTNDGQMRTVTAADPGRVVNSWPCSGPFVSGVSVADIDGDGINELVVSTAKGKIVALRLHIGTEEPQTVLWEVDGGPIPVPGAMARAWTHKESSCWIVEAI